MHVDTKTARLPVAAELADDLTRVAQEFGVFVDLSAKPGDVAIDNLSGLQALTKRQVVELDQTGGLDRLAEILSEKTSATEVIAIDPKPSIAARIGRAVRAATRALVSAAKRAAKAIKDALSWLASPVGVLHEWNQNRRLPELYTGRHRPSVAWYGAQRSTMSRVAVQRKQRSGRQPADSEPALPEYWVSHVARAIEAIRGHEDVLHPKAGYQFRC